MPLVVCDLLTPVDFSIYVIRPAVPMYQIFVIYFIFDPDLMQSYMMVIWLHYSLLQQNHDDDLFNEAQGSIRYHVQIYIYYVCHN